MFRKRIMAMCAAAALITAGISQAAVPVLAAEEAAAVYDGVTITENDSLIEISYEDPVVVLDDSLATICIHDVKLDKAEGRVWYYYSVRNKSENTYVRVFFGNQSFGEFMVDYGTYRSEGTSDAVPGGKDSGLRGAGSEDVLNVKTLEDLKSFSGSIRIYPSDDPNSYGASHGEDYSITFEVNLEKLDSAVRLSQIETSSKIMAADISSLQIPGVTIQDSAEAVDLVFDEPRVLLDDENVQVCLTELKLEYNSKVWYYYTIKNKSETLYMREFFGNESFGDYMVNYSSYSSEGSSGSILPGKNSGVRGKGSQDISHVSGLAELLCFSGTIRIYPSDDPNSYGGSHGEDYSAPFVVDLRSELAEGDPAGTTAPENDEAAGEADNEKTAVSLWGDVWSIQPDGWSEEELSNGILLFAPDEHDSSIYDFFTVSQVEMENADSLSFEDKESLMDSGVTAFYDSYSDVVEEKEITVAGCQARRVKYRHTDITKPMQDGNGELVILTLDDRFLWLMLIQFDESDIDAYEIFEQFVDSVYVSEDGSVPTDLTESASDNGDTVKEDAVLTTEQIDEQLQGYWEPDESKKGNFKFTDGNVEVDFDIEGKQVKGTYQVDPDLEEITCILHGTDGDVRAHIAYKVEDGVLGLYGNQGTAFHKKTTASADSAGADAEYVESLIAEQEVRITSTRYVVQDANYKYLYPDILAAAITNDSPVALKNVEVAYVAWDSNNLPILLHGDRGSFYSLSSDLNGINIPAGGTETDWGLYVDPKDDNIAKYKAIVLRYEDFDGKKWTNPYFDEWLACYEGKVLTEPKYYTDQETIRKVQTGLNEAGYECGTPDGIAGPKTYEALNAYQAANGLAVTNNITDALLEKMGIS